MCNIWSTRKLHFLNTFSFRRNLPPLFTAAAAAALNQYLPYPSFAPLFSHLTPALETLAGSRALTALAQAQKRLRDTFEDQVEEPKSKKSRKVDSPLDLTKNSCNEDEVDVLSIDPPSPSNVEQWSVDKVADFVSNVESCREYAQVRLMSPIHCPLQADVRFPLLTRLQCFSH